MNGRQFTEALRLADEHRKHDAITRLTTAVQDLSRREDSNLDPAEVAAIDALLTAAGQTRTWLVEAIGALEQHAQLTRKVASLADIQTRHDEARRQLDTVLAENARIVTSDQRAVESWKSRRDLAVATVEQTASDLRGRNGAQHNLHELERKHRDLLAEAVAA